MRNNSTATHNWFGSVIDAEVQTTATKCSPSLNDPSAEKVEVSFVNVVPAEDNGPTTGKVRVSSFAGLYTVANTVTPVLCVVRFRQNSTS